MGKHLRWLPEILSLFAPWPALSPTPPAPPPHTGGGEGEAHVALVGARRHQPAVAGQGDQRAGAAVRGPVERLDQPICGGGEAEPGSRDPLADVRVSKNGARQLGPPLPFGGRRVSWGPIS